MFDNVSKMGKKSMFSGKDGAKKKLLKETMRRVRKENIGDRGPLQKPSSLKTS